VLREQFFDSIGLAGVNASTALIRFEPIELEIRGQSTAELPQPRQ
jgi:hypothetical protein